jgi:hypothetical protein
MKRRRGRGQNPGAYPMKKIFTVHDDVKDDDAIAWAIPLVKRNLFRRFSRSQSDYTRDLLDRLGSFETTSSQDNPPLEQ